MIAEQRIRRKFGFIGAFAIAASLVTVACGGGESTLLGMTREQALEVGAVEVTDVTAEGLYADHDSSFAMKARPGSLLVVYFGYTNCPDLCPTTLALVRAARRELGGSSDRIDLAMVTVDPDRDTPEVMNGYLSSFTDRFHALHPLSMEELKSAEEAFLASSTIVTDASGKIEVGHSATTYVVDENGIVLIEWPFGVDKNTMINDFRILLDRV
ncbi:MAG: SCO family protein [Actinomycetota bacterium]